MDTEGSTAGKHSVDSSIVVPPTTLSEQQASAEQTTQAAITLAEISQDRQGAAPSNKSHVNSKLFASPSGVLGNHMRPSLAENLQSADLLEEHRTKISDSSSHGEAQNKGAGQIERSGATDTNVSPVENKHFQSDTSVSATTTSNNNYLTETSVSAVGAPSSGSREKVKKGTPRVMTLYTLNPVGPASSNTGAPSVASVAVASPTTAKCQTQSENKTSRTSNKDGMNSVLNLTCPKLLTLPSVSDVSPNCKPEMKYVNAVGKPLTCETNHQSDVPQMVKAESVIQTQKQNEKQSEVKNVPHNTNPIIKIMKFSSNEAAHMRSSSLGNERENEKGSNVQPNEVINEEKMNEQRNEVKEDEKENESFALKKAQLIAEGRSSTTSPSDPLSAKGTKPNDEPFLFNKQDRMLKTYSRKQVLQIEQGGIRYQTVIQPHVYRAMKQYGMLYFPPKDGSSPKLGVLQPPVNDILGGDCTNSSSSRDNHQLQLKNGVIETKKDQSASLQRVQKDLREEMSDKNGENQPVKLMDLQKQRKRQQMEEIIRIRKDCNYVNMYIIKLPNAKEHTCADIAMVSTSKA